MMECKQTIALSAFVQMVSLEMSVRIMWTNVYLFHVWMDAAQTTLGPLSVNVMWDIRELCARLRLTLVHLTHVWMEDCAPANVDSSLAPVRLTSLASYVIQRSMTAYPILVLMEGPVRMELRISLACALKILKGGCAIPASLTVVLNAPWQALECVCSASLVIFYAKVQPMVRFPTL